MRSRKGLLDRGRGDILEVKGVLELVLLSAAADTPKSTADACTLSSCGHMPTHETRQVNGSAYPAYT